MLYEPVSTNAFMLKVNVANCSCEWLETFKSLLFCSCLPLLCQNMYHTHLKKTWHMYQEVCRSQHACNTIVSCSYRVSSQVWNMNSVCISNTQHDIAMVSNKLKQVETSWNKLKQIFHGFGQLWSSDVTWKATVHWMVAATWTMCAVTIAQNRTQSCRRKRQERHDMLMMKFACAGHRLHLRQLW